MCLDRAVAGCYCGSEDECGVCCASGPSSGRLAVQSVLYVQVRESKMIITITNTFYKRGVTITSLAG